MKNIAIGKIGKSILFDSKKWGAIGGDIDAPVFYENLFHHNPDINFWLLGKSDFGTIDKSLRDRINKHKNVFDMYEGLKEYQLENIPRWKEIYKDKYSGNDLHQYSSVSCAWEYINDVVAKRIPKMDAGLFFSGPDGTSNIPNSVRLARDPSKIASPLMSLIGYVGPIYEFINRNNLPYIYICTDPRYYPSRGNDLLVTPKKVLSQYNTVGTHHHYTSYTDTTKVFNTVPIEYNKIETIFLLGKSREPQKDSGLASFFEDTPKEKTSDFNIILNEGRPSRYNMLKEYVLDHVTDVNIYGKWDHPDTKTDQRFKGPKHFYQLEDMLLDTKYTFIIPIKKGWVTAKFWEMIYYGIIPFMHPTYDTQYNLKVPDFIRVKSASDLKDKIDRLNSDKKFYEELKSELTNMLTPDLFDGSYLNNLVISALRDITK